MSLPLRSLANGLTIARAVAGLPLILALQADAAALAWWLLLMAGLSDAADGWLARRAGGGSSWGARLDPLTDKVLIAAPLLWLAAAGNRHWPDALPVHKEPQGFGHLKFRLHPANRRGHAR